MFSLIYVWINDWANNREAGDLRRQHGHYDVIVMNYPGLSGIYLITILSTTNKNNLSLGYYNFIIGRSK